MISLRIAADGRHPRALQGQTQLEVGLAGAVVGQSVEEGKLGGRSANAHYQLSSVASSIRAAGISDRHAIVMVSLQASALRRRLVCRILTMVRKVNAEGNVVLVFVFTALLRGFGCTLMRFYARCRADSDRSPLGWVACTCATTC
eukprot:COSAG05_NODE_2794_length_2629_cov_10.743402_2_plen_145_part_00